jgi:hypothetical protein
VDAAAGGAFFSLTIERATTLIEKMVSNQGWSDDRLQPRQRVMHSVKETDMLGMKIDLLLKKFKDYSQDKAQMQTLQARYEDKARLGVLMLLSRSGVMLGHG